MGSAVLKNRVYLWLAWWLCVSMGFMRGLVGVAVVAVGVLLTGCGSAGDVKAEARAAVDEVYVGFSPAMLEADGYDELADGLVDDAAENCDRVDVYVSGLNGDELLEDAFRAAVAVVCD